MSKGARSWLGLGLLALAVVTLAGCQRQRTLATPVPTAFKGKITWRGEPVRFAIVNFEPVNGHGAEADGCTGEDGTFEMRSFANDGSMDGVVPAQYRLVLEPYDIVRMVAKRPLPPGVVPTALPGGGEWDTEVIVDVKEGDNDVDIVIP